MNKTALAYGREEYSQTGGEISRENRQSQRCHAAAKEERNAEILLAGHSPLAIHRLIEMG